MSSTSMGRTWSTSGVAMRTSLVQGLGKRTPSAVGDVLRFGIGYALTGKDMSVDWIPEGRICFWGGFCGSVAIMDVDRKMTVSSVMKKMENVGLGNYRTKQYVRAVYIACNAL